jgi:hypothetical protein
MQYAKIPPTPLQDFSHERFLFPLLDLRLFVDTDALENQYLAPVVSNARYAQYTFDVLTLDMPY